MEYSFLENTQLHSHHYDVMHNLLLKQKSFEEGHAFVTAAPTGPKMRGNMHDSISQVHSIVMEDVMKRHQLNHVVVGEMRVIQRSHEKLMNEILTQKLKSNNNTDNTDNANADADANANAATKKPKKISDAQKQHSKLMTEIMGRHGISLHATEELTAIHTHHHSLAYNLVHRDVAAFGKCFQK